MIWTPQERIPVFLYPTAFEHVRLETPVEAWTTSTGKLIWDEDWPMLVLVKETKEFNARYGWILTGPGEMTPYDMRVMSEKFGRPRGTGYGA